MREYKDEYNCKKKHDEKDDDKSREDIKEFNDESERENNFVGKGENDKSRDILFEPKGDLASDIDDFVPDEKRELIKMDFKPDKEYKPEMDSFEPNSDISLDVEDFKPDKEYKPDMDSFEPKSDISLDIEDFKPDKNYHSDNNCAELNGENNLNKDQEKDDSTLEVDREHEQDNNSFDENFELTYSRSESNNDCESDFPIQPNKDQIRTEIEEKKEGLENKDDDNPFEKSNEELKTKDKEQFVESAVVNREINLEYLIEHDLKDLIEKIRRAENEGLIYAPESLAYAKDLYLNEKPSAKIEQKREESNDTSGGVKKKNGKGVIIENLNDFRLFSGEDIDQEREKNTDPSQIKEFNRNIKKEFSNPARETNKDERVISEKENGVSTGRDSKQYTVQVLKRETQPLNQAEKRQDPNEKSFKKEENQKSEKEKQEKKEEGAADQVKIYKQMASSQDLKSRDKDKKTDTIEKQEKKDEIRLITDELAIPDSSASKELNDLKEKYRQESGKRPIYRGKETKGFVEWKREKAKLIKSKTIDSTNSLDTSDIKTQKNSEIPRIQTEKSLKKKEIKEGWESTLKNWVSKANEKDVSSEGKKELTEAIELCGEIWGNHKELEQLIRKYKNRTINKNEVKKLISLNEKFEKVKPNLKELFINFLAFRNFYLANEIWYNERILAEKEKFTKFIYQKVRLLKKKIELSGGIEEISIKYHHKSPEEQKIKDLPYNVEKSIENLDSREFKNYYEGPYSKYFESKISQNNILDLLYLVRQNRKYLEMLRAGMKIHDVLSLYYLETTQENLGKYKLNYTSQELLENILNDIKKDSEILRKFFPNAFSRLHSKFSRFWYDRVKNDLTQNILTSDLIKLKEILNEKYPKNAEGCIKVIENFEQGKFTAFQFIEQVEKEWAIISGNVHIDPIYLRDLLFFGAWSVGYVRRILLYINDKSLAYDPSFDFSRENLEIMKTSLIKNIGFEKSKNYLRYIDKYSLSNPDLKVYSHQAYEIENPYYFSFVDYIDDSSIQWFLTKIDNMDRELFEAFKEKLYWFGFFCGDLHLDPKRNRFLFGLQEQDKLYVELCANALGYTKKIRPKDENEDYFYIEFKCKPLVNDLERLGWFSSYSIEKNLPSFIIVLIKEAKKISIKRNIDWYETNAGGLALTWLYGFYDAEGSVSSKYSGMISQGGKGSNGEHVGRILLQQIKDFYEVPNKVRLFEGTNYRLTLGSELLSAMKRIYSKGFVRK